MSNWIAFADRRPPARPAGGMILVTNNIEARDRFGKMTHVWLAHMVHYHDDGPNVFNGHEFAAKGEITAFAHPGDMPLRCLTHWRPAVPEEWVDFENGLVAGGLECCLPSTGQGGLR